MAKIKDFGKSTPRRANTTYTWGWEVIVQKFDDNSCETYDEIVARFFDPWKAVQYGCEKYGGMCIVQATLLKTDYLEKE